jgi:fucose permease
MLILILSLPLWKRAPGALSSNDAGAEKTSFRLPALLKLPKAKVTLLTFFSYCAIEATVGLWGSTYLVLIRNIDEKLAAAWIALYFLGITLGRMLSGFMSMKLSQKFMIRLGLVVITFGIIVLFLPFEGKILMAGLFLIGLGLAPIFPSLLHETPRTFGKTASQAMIGTQMACAYIGTTCMPPIFGLLGRYVSYALFPYFLIILLMIMILTSCLIYRKRIVQEL